MRFIIAFSVFAFGIGHSMAVEKPKYNPPKEQWVQITRPVIGCFNSLLGGDLHDSPELIQGLETENTFENKNVTCSLMSVGEHYILDAPVDGYSALVSVVCEHCAPSAYVVYTKAKAGFYKLIPAPVKPTEN